MRKVYCTDFRVLVTFPRDSGNGFIKRSFFETIQTLQGFAGQRLSLSALSVPLLPQPQPRLQRQRLLLIGRLQRLQRLGLADEAQPGTWTVHNDAEKTLRALGERGDIIRTMQRAMRGEPRGRLRAGAADKMV